MRRDKRSISTFPTTEAIGLANDPCLCRDCSLTCPAGRDDLPYDVFGPWYERILGFSGTHADVKTGAPLLIDPNRLLDRTTNAGRPSEGSLPAGRGDQAPVLHTSG